jgi:acetyltransferase-like isoleucine patch superfamily enzyme
VVFKYAPHGGIHIGNKCFIGPNCTIDVPPGAELVIGDNVGFTAGVLLSSQKSICIGNDCLIAEWVSIRDAQHNFRVGTAIRLQGLSALPVVIESDVWIGRASCIIYGAVLQHGCVVGANSFVKGSTLDANGIYVGTPVRKSGSRS